MEILSDGGSTGGVTRVVRIGNTVRRPVRPFTGTVQAYLTHLREEGFLDAPEPFGYDEEGREVLSYIVGEVPVEPLPFRLQSSPAGPGRQ
jgi:hypothetical protein